MNERKKREQAEIVFLTPPAVEKRLVAERVFGCGYSLYSLPNIFALTLAAVLKEKGYGVRCVDAPSLGWSMSKFREFLRSDRGALYCIYSVNLSADADRLALRAVREARGRIPVVFVGPAPTLDPEGFIEDEAVFVVRGEMEVTLPELAAALIDEGDRTAPIEGVSCLEDGKVRHAAPRPLIEDLDALPFPSRELQRRDGCFDPKLGERPATALITSRGCPHGCIFCVPNSLSFAREIEYKRWNGKKPPVAKRSARSVIDEFSQLAESGFRAVKVLDDLFVLGEERTVAICDGIGGIGVRWSCLCRADSLNETVVKALAAANCAYVDIGVETFDPKALDFIRKKISIDCVNEAVRMAGRHGIKVKLNLMLGCSPFETTESVRRTMRRVKALKPDCVTYSICTPFPGTEYYDIARKEGWLIHDEYRPVDVRRTATMSFPGISADELERFVNRADRSFYLSPRFIARNLGRMTRPADFAAAAAALMRKLFR